MARLLDAGVIGAAGARAALDQRFPPLSPDEALRTARGARRAPRLTARLLRGLAVAPLLAAHYRRYPLHPSLGHLKRWSSAAGRLFGEAPDRP